MWLSNTCDEDANIAEAEFLTVEQNIFVQNNIGDPTERA